VSACMQSTHALLPGTASASGVHKQQLVHHQLLWLSICCVAVLLLQLHFGHTLYAAFV
jgi:hypothetical protein